MQPSHNWPGSGGRRVSWKDRRDVARSGATDRYYRNDDTRDPSRPASWSAWTWHSLPRVEVPDEADVQAALLGLNPPERIRPDRQFRSDYAPRNAALEDLVRADLGPGPAMPSAYARARDRDLPHTAISAHEVESRRRAFVQKEMNRMHNDDRYSVWDRDALVDEAHRRYEAAERLRGSRGADRGPTRDYDGPPAGRRPPPLGTRVGTRVSCARKIVPGMPRHRRRADAERARGATVGAASEAAGRRPRARESAQPSRRTWRSAVVAPDDTHRALIRDGPPRLPPQRPQQARPQEQRPQQRRPQQRRPQQQSATWTSGERPSGVSWDAGYRRSAAQKRLETDVCDWGALSSGLNALKRQLGTMNISVTVMEKRREEVRRKQEAAKAARVEAAARRSEEPGQPRMPAAPRAGLRTQYGDRHLSAAQHVHWAV